MNGLGRKWVTRMGLAVGGPGLLGAMVTGCAPKDVTPAWIDDNTAYLRCETVGDESGASTTLQGMTPPNLKLPSGFYVGDMQKSALTVAGFAKGSVACAMMVAPRSSLLVESKSSLLALAKERRELAAMMGPQRPCACESLYEQGLRGLLAACESAPLDRNCLGKPQGSPAWDTQVRKVRAQIQETRVPLRHWRLVGRSGNDKGWERNYPRLLGAFKGGSEVFLRRKPVSAGKNRALVQALLGEPGVVAVVRQDQGQALLVVRVLPRDQLVFDYFSYPTTLDASTRLRALLDNANIETFKEALAPPQHPRSWASRGKSQRGWGWSRPALTRVDAEQEVLSYLDTRPYDRKREIWRPPSAVAEQGWLETLGSGDPKKGKVGWRLTLVEPKPSLWGEEPTNKTKAARWTWPRFAPADARRDFPLRASAFGQGWVYALSTLPQAAQAAAFDQIGQWESEGKSFRYRWRAGAWPDRIFNDAQTQAFFDQLRAKPGQWRWSTSPDGQRAQLELEIGETEPFAPREAPVRSSESH